MYGEWLLTPSPPLPSSPLRSDYVSLGPRAYLLLRAAPTSTGVRATDEAGQPLTVRVAVRVDGRGAGSVSTERVDMHGAVTAPAPAPAPVPGAGGGAGAGRGAAYISGDCAHVRDVDGEWDVNDSASASAST